MKKHVKGFSPLYVGGEDWYTALGFVFDYGGSIAKLSHGKWHGTLDSKKSLAGLKRFKAFFRATQAKRTATLDASGLGAGNPFPYTVYSQGRTAANYGPALVHLLHRQEVHEGHEAVRDAEPYQGQADSGLPRRLRPSRCRPRAIRSRRRSRGSPTSRARQARRRSRQKGNIPNATNLLGNSVNERAAARSWFVPQAKHWVDVENGNILKTMLGQILTGRLTVKQAAQTASHNIAQTLNGS